MGTTIQKLAYLAQTKTDIRESLQDKGSAVTESDTFRSYADFVTEVGGKPYGGSIKLKMYGGSGTAGSITVES